MVCITYIEVIEFDYKYNNKVVIIDFSYNKTNFYCYLYVNKIFPFTGFKQSKRYTLWQM
jgi:nicotinamide riboside kinase